MVADKRDYYEVLGVDRNAAPTEEMVKAVSQAAKNLLTRT